MKRISLGLSALCLVGLTAACGSSQASKSAPDAEETVAALRGRFDSYSIAPEVQDQLIKKFLAGAPLDADIGATPVTSEVLVVSGQEKTRYVYADGSVAMSSVETPAAETAESSFLATGNATRSITGCNSRVDSHGTHIYSNCKIAWDAATWSVSWTADFDYNVNGSAITSAKSLHFGGVGDFSGAGTEIVTLRADNKGTAIADGYVNQKLTVAGVGSTRRVGVRLQVAARWTDRKSKESPFST